MNYFEQAHNQPSGFQRDDHQTQGFDWAHLKPYGFPMLTTKHSVFLSSPKTQWFFYAHHQTLGFKANQKPCGFHVLTINTSPIKGWTKPLGFIREYTKLL